MADTRRNDGTTRGGQELPESVQDRPDQNAGYDAAANDDPVSGAAADEEDDAFDDEDDELDDEDGEDADEEEEEA